MTLSFTAPQFEVEDLEEDIKNLSQDKKEQLFRNIYGDDQMIDETPELITDTLSQLNEELSSIDDKEVYDWAQEECCNYVNSNKILLQVLRTELFDATEAAKRIVNYWEQKLRTFGEDRTFEPITIDQLEGSDTWVLKKALHLLPKDDFGWIVVHVDRGSFKVNELLFYCKFLVCGNEVCYVCW